MKQPTVLIISDDAAFSSAIAGRWKAEHNQPAFTLMSSDLCGELDPATFDLAVVGGLDPDALFHLEQTLTQAKKPSIFILSSGQIVKAGPWTRILNREKGEGKNGWMEPLVLVLSEMLLHAKAAAAVQELEWQNAILERQAALGSYIIDVRHNLNNALTSILGNSELLLLDGHAFTASMRSQVETVRNMAIRIHEILQRFSSLEKELAVNEEQARPKNRIPHQDHVRAAKA